MKIAIIGATSHIAKNLIFQNSEAGKWDLYLFARNKDKMVRFLKDCLNGISENINMVDDFQKCSVRFDAIINCVGFGTPDKVQKAEVDLFYLTESIDNKILQNLEKNPKTVYINFSSGAVYGTVLDKPVGSGYKSVFEIQPLEDREYYRIAKLNSEAKHRSLKEYQIIDIRLFSFFSRFIDLDGKFLMTEIVKSLKNREPFKTSNIEIFRDFISPKDLYNLVAACVESNNINTSIDSYSKEIVSKSELLKALSKEFELIVESTDSVYNSPTGLKVCYYSKNKNATSMLNYRPLKSSIETIIDEIKVLLR